MINLRSFWRKLSTLQNRIRSFYGKKSTLVALVSVSTILTFTTKRYIPSNQSKIEIILMKIEDVAKLLLEQDFFHTVISTEDWYISDREFLLTMPKNNESIFVCQLLLHSDVTKNFKKKSFKTLTIK